MNTLQTLQPIVKDLSRWQRMAGDTAAAKNATAYFRKHVGEAKTPADLVKNPRLFQYAMTAFGMGDRTYAKSLVTKVLNQGITSNSSLAMTLHDPNIFALAKAFDFVDNGAKTTSSKKLVDQVVAKYNEATLEQQQGENNTGVQLALHFLANASNIKSPYDILADKNLLKVVQTALNISPQSALQDIDKQAAQIASRLNVADFQHPAKLTEFVQKFAVQYDVQQAAANSPSNVLMLDTSTQDAQNANATSMLSAINGGGRSGNKTAGILSLFNTSSSKNAGFDQSVLLKLQGFKAVV